MRKLFITGFVLVTIFNIKLFAQTNVTTEGGNANYVPKFYSSYVIGNGTIFDNGNIGIGTVSPSGKFHLVTTGAKTANYSGTILSNTAFSSTSSITKSCLEISSTGTWAGTSAKNIGLYISSVSSASNNIGIYVSSVSGGATNYDAIFNGGGNVGIGTTSPSAKLEVNGQIKITGGTPGDGKIFTSDANGLASWLSPTFWSLTGNSGTTAGTNFIGTTDVKDLVFKTNNAERIRVSSSGNVGIGTSSPQYKFDVMGEARVSYLRCVSQALFAGENGYPLGIGFDFFDVETGLVDIESENVIAGFKDYGNGKRYVFGGNSANTGLVVNPANGNVGIGTSDPGEKLTVVGYGKFASENGWTGIGHDGVNSFLNSSSTLLINYYSGQNVVVGGGGGSNPATGNFVTTYDTYLSIYNGKVGVGSSLPTTIPSKLYVKGDGATNQTSSFNVANSNGNSMFIINDDGKVGIGTNNSNSMLQVSSSDVDGLIISTNSTTGSNYCIKGVVDNSSTKAISIINGATENFLVKGDGKVWAREVTVTLSSPLGDFVFDKDYNLMSLKDLEVYVNKNKHLPGVPSANNVDKNGLNVGEFQNLLLQKVEEMSLYIINQDKKAEENTVCIANQNKKIEEMSLLILQLEKRIKELEK